MGRNPFRKKTFDEMNAELARLNAEIRRLNAEARLERTRTRARQAKGKASLSLAKAKHKRRVSRFTELRDRALARGYSLSRAVKYAKERV